MGNLFLEQIVKGGQPSRSLTSRFSGHEAAAFSDGKYTYTQLEIREAIKFIQENPKPQKSFIFGRSDENREAEFEAKKRNLTPDVARLVDAGSEALLELLSDNPNPKRSNGVYDRSEVEDAKEFMRKTSRATSGAARLFRGSQAEREAQDLRDAVELKSLGSDVAELVEAEKSSGSRNRLRGKLSPIERAEEYLSRNDGILSEKEIREARAVFESREAVLEQGVGKPLAAKGRDVEVLAQEYLRQYNSNVFGRDEYSPQAVNARPFSREGDPAIKAVEASGVKINPFLDIRSQKSPEPDVHPEGQCNLTSQTPNQLQAAAAVPPSSLPLSKDGDVSRQV